MQDSLDYAIALIAKRFGDDATIQEVAQEASAQLHNPWTKSGRWCLSHKRDRAAFEGDMWSASASARDGVKKKEGACSHTGVSSSNSPLLSTN